MKKRWLTFLLVPGAFLIVAVGGILIVGTFMLIRAKIATGKPNVDRFQSRVALGTLWNFWTTPGMLVPVGRALMAIINQETEGLAAPQIGDRQNALGPSVGPGQVLRATAIDLGLVPPDTTPEAYMNYATDENWGIDAMIAVFKSKLDKSGGDIGQAIQLYNGTGPKAENYRGEVFSWLGQTFGDNPLGTGAIGAV